MRSVDGITEINLKKASAKILKDLPGYRSLSQFETSLNRIKNFLRKSIITIFSFSLTNTLSLVLLGIVNRLLGRPIRSIFLCYPAQEKYAHKYGFSWVFEYARTNPLIVGAYFQNKRIGLILAAYVQENYFRNNKEYLTLIQSSLDRTRRLVGAELVHFSGTLPSEMNRLSIIDQEYFKDRCDLVAEIVIDAERAVRELENIFEVCPVLLLGGKGNIGSVMKEKFILEGREVHIVDRGETIPETLRNRRAILIDVSRKGVLETRLDQLWPNLTILNESFPEPEKNTVEILNSMGINVYHVAGVKAKAFPPFPYGYAGGIPCCAAIRENNVKSLVKKL